MNKNRHISSFHAAYLSLFLALPAFAQTLPDAGSLQQQMKRERRPALPPSTTPITPAEPSELKPSTGVVLTVKAFRFSGNTLLTNEELAQVVAGYLNRPLKFAELQQVTTAVANAYRRAGWVVRVYLPKQDVSAGIVTIQIIEAVFGGVKLEGPEPHRIKLSKLLSIFDQQPKGKPLNTKVLDRALLLADDLPGVTIAGTLRKGQSAGETDLILRMADEPLIVGEASVDNTGSRSTGSDRLNVDATLNSPLRVGDQLDTYLTHSQGADYTQVSYGLPLGSEGWRIGANVSRLDYRLIVPEFLSLKAHGNFTGQGIDISYPLIRSRKRNLFLSVALDDRRFENFANDAITSRYGIRDLSFNAEGNLFDSLGGGGANLVNVSLTAGRLDLSGSPNSAADASTTRSQGRFTKLCYLLSRQQTLTPDLSLYAKVSGQVASKNLDSSEKFYLGGINGVRAYPISEGGGSEGMLASMELRWRLGNNRVLSGFTDWGRVTINRNNSYTGAPSLNTGELAGAGMSLAGEIGFGLNLKATYAHRLGSNPFRNMVTGNDQNGSHIKDRFWLQATRSF